MAANGLPNIARQHKAQIIERLAAGDRLKDIAADLGLKTHSHISSTFANDPEYKAAVLTSAWAKLEQREKEMEGAQEQADISRARELLNHARWWAERIDRNTFAQKPDIAININNIGTIDGALGADAAGLLDKLRGSIIDASPQTEPETEKPLIISKGSESGSEIICEDSRVTD